MLVSELNRALMDSDNVPSSWCYIKQACFLFGLNFALKFKRKKNFCTCFQKLGYFFIKFLMYDKLSYSNKVPV